MIADISVYQGNIDWDKFSKNLDFVIIRASVGTNTDKNYKKNADSAADHGVPYHAYHFVKAVSVSAACKEANVFAKATAGTNPLFYVIDAEYASISASRARTIMEAFEAELRRAIGKDIKVGVYIGHHLYKSWNLDYKRYTYVWIPRYGSNTGEPIIKPAYSCDIWQFTSKGKAPGVSGYIDLNMLNSNKPLDYYIGRNAEPISEVKQSLLGKRTLKKGCVGDDVKELQQGLIKMGFDCGRWGADGDFGSATKQAVKAFQKKYGLVIDGIFGPKSYNKWRDIT